MLKICSKYIIKRSTLFCKNFKKTYSKYINNRSTQNWQKMFKTCYKHVNKRSTNISQFLLLKPLKLSTHNLQKCLKHVTNMLKKVPHVKIRKILLRSDSAVQIEHGVAE